MRGQTHCTIFSTGLLSEGPNTLHDFQHQCHTWLEPVLSPNVSSNPHLRCIGHDTPSNGGSSTCLKETPDPAQQNQRSRINAGSSNAGSSTPDPKHNARNPSRSAESTGARLKETPDPAQQNQRGIARPTPPLSLSACIGPARIGISRPTSPLARPPSTAEDHRGSRVYWFRHRPVNSTW